MMATRRERCMERKDRRAAKIVRTQKGSADDNDDSESYVVPVAAVYGSLRCVVFDSFSLGHL